MKTFKDVQSVIRNLMSHVKQIRQSIDAEVEAHNRRFTNMDDRYSSNPYCIRGFRR